VSVQFEVRDHLAIVTIDRPAARNAVDGSVATGIEAAIDRVESDDNLWLTILCGTPPVFCAGADLRAVSEGRAAEISTKRGGFGGFVTRERDKPVIAAIEGAALAGGCELALACDLIVASRSARFGIPEVLRSLVAAAGGLVRLPQAVPVKVAMEMALTGQPISAERATELGLVNRLVDEGRALDGAVELAQQISLGAPLAVRRSRAIILEAAGGNTAAAWEMSAAALRDLATTEDFKEGPRAFLERRQPVWHGA
jgi:enoyl-CoA hydratase